jgi:hypothetical protein
MLFTNINLTLIFIMTLLPQFAMSKSQLPVLSTKQEINNLRFISSDGKVSYFQNSSGKLMLTSNLKNFDLISAEDYAHYSVIVSPTKRYIAIEQDASYNLNFNLSKENTIFISVYGDGKVKKIGSGNRPMLHLNDQYISYYNYKTREITVLKTQNLEKVTTIVLKNELNPFFTPVTVMLSPNIVLYSDVNKDGFQALMKLETSKNEITPFYKSKSAGTKIESCRFENSLIVGEFSYPNINRGSSISSFPLNDGQIGEVKLLYSSSLNDIGNLICLAPDSLYFIKSFFEDQYINYNKTDVASINLKTGQVEIRSDLLKTTQIYEMDQRVLIPLNDQLYVVTGETNLNLDKLKDDRDFTFIKAPDEFNEMYDTKKASKKNKKKKNKKNKQKSKK